MNAFFTELGRTVRAQWQAENFTLARFPEIARRALEERPTAEHVDLGALMREFLLEDEQPFQTQSGFGQPELVVYDDPRFYIQILFWLEGTTDIHQHMFSGAFHVMEGSSLHSRFRFSDAVAVTPHLQLGHLQMTDTRLLETGSTVQIVSGGEYIHSLFHLEMPSLTVVIRTHTDPGTGPQYTYLPPHLAVDPFHHDALTARRKQLLDVLERMDDPGYAKLVLEMIRKLDFERGFFILQNGMSYLRGLGRWNDALAAFRSRHGALADAVPPTLDEIVRRDGLAALRGTITEVEHRFFLALLLNVPDRPAILEMVAQRFTGPPLETIARWAAELCETTSSGTWLVDAEFPETLEIPEAQQPDMFVAAVRGLIGLDPAAVPPALRAALLRSSWNVLVE